MNFTTLIKKYKVRFIFNLLLILLEAGLALLFPLLIGHAIDDALNSSYNGVIGLGLLG
ncbi:MAG: hypothetical protein KI790_02410, partial [Cyclobacteriaceae bacterium]|nr:hypothetical protein [Cyclobacteriaceae bacterium HetDA_MAG_MS6]